MEVAGNYHCSDSHQGSIRYAAGIPSPKMPEKDNIYGNLQWDISLGWVYYFAPLGEGELHNLHWDFVVLMQT